jgi:hypothetical protein
LSQLVDRFEDKYELKVNYADYLLTRLLDKESHSFTVFGCLACLEKFGPTVAKKILVPQIEAIASMIESQKDQQNHEEMRQTNLKMRKGICTDLHDYLTHNEQSSVDLIREVQQAIQNFFP